MRIIEVVVVVWPIDMTQEEGDKDKWIFYKDIKNESDKDVSYVTMTCEECIKIKWWYSSEFDDNLKIWSDEWDWL